MPLCFGKNAFAAAITAAGLIEVRISWIMPCVPGTGGRSARGARGTRSGCGSVLERERERELRSRRGGRFQRDVAAEEARQLTRQRQAEPRAAEPARRGA